MNAQDISNMRDVLTRSKFFTGEINNEVQLLCLATYALFEIALQLAEINHKLNGVIEWEGEQGHLRTDYFVPPS